MSKIKNINLSCDHTTSKGRFFQEQSPTDFRTPFQRDRDRIIHTQAFRRLKHKTQVFISGVSDHYRTRLTHTIEVTQVARSIARAIGVDQDLAEALALAHDLGHPPFGHAGENALNSKMEKFGGFDHNAQTLKILTQLEEKYAAYPGLNLCWETLEGIAKHNGPLLGKFSPKKELHKFIVEYNNKHDLELDKFSSLEAQIAAISDDIAYNAHDIEDGIRSELITFEQVCELTLVKQSFESIKNKYPNAKKHLIISETIRCVLRNMIYDVIGNIEKNVIDLGINSSSDIRNANQLIANFSNDMLARVNELRQFLKVNVYRHYKVNRMTKKAEMVLANLFDYFMDSPACLPEAWYERYIEEGESSMPEVICDYLAGMTDNFAIKEHALLFNLEKQNL
ncbi:MAG: deoxyguanosinetriphosphate triphosphohydrolase [Sphingobacteriia bacterium]|nr:deoxyguanosinetriphosphate triphosphohydrolase [Sphingobacteriia bacterium]